MRDMALSAAERQKKRRDKLRIQETISVRLTLPSHLHSKLRKEAKLKEKGFHEWLKLNLKRE